MKADDIIKATITGITSYGIFVKSGEYNGLVHISEISDRYVNQIDDLFTVGEEIELLVLDINKKKQQLVLSYKKAMKINPEIMREIDIKIGFRTLKEQLPIWLDEKNKQNK